VEWLTDEMEERTYEYLAKIEDLGGILPAIKTGFIQREIADTSYKYQKQMENGQRAIVGVNVYKMNEASPIETLKIDERVRIRQIERLREVRKTRAPNAVKHSLEELQKSFKDPESNCIYPMLKAVKAYATLGEIVDVGLQVFGDWKEPSIL
jgi:methylmalonyl-CoA mutase N-terminal domain/subunit